MIKVNLVPRELLDREVQRQRIIQASAAGAVAVIVVLVVSALHWFSATRYEAELVDLNREYDKLAKIVAQVEELERTASAVRTRLGVINGLLKGRPLYPVFMTDLQATMPPDVWFNTVATTPKDPNGLTVTLTNATAASSKGVSDWLRNLERAGKWDEPKIGAINVTDKGDTKEYTFTISTAYKSNL